MGVRKLKRHSQSRRINYYDDADNQDSEEEEYNADSNIEQDLPPYQEDELSDLIDDDD